MTRHGIEPRSPGTQFNNSEYFCRGRENEESYQIAEVTWYFPRVTRRICHCSLKHDLGIHYSRPTWPCLIVEIHATGAKFILPSGYCIVINCAITFCTTNVGCFRDPVWTREAYVPELNYVARSSMRLSNHTQNKAKNNASARQLPRTTNHSWYLSRIELLRSWDMHVANLHIQKHEQNFWLVQVFSIKRLRLYTWRLSRFFTLVVKDIYRVCVCVCVRNLVWFGLVWFSLVWFGLVLWHINHYWLFNAKSCFYIYIKYIWFVKTFSRYKKLNDQIVLFLIHSSVSQPS